MTDRLKTYNDMPIENLSCRPNPSFNSAVKNDGVRRSLTQLGFQSVDLMGFLQSVEVVNGLKDF